MSRPRPSPRSATCAWAPSRVAWLTMMSPHRRAGTIRSRHPPSIPMRAKPRCSQGQSYLACHTFELALLAPLRITIPLRDGRPVDDVPPGFDVIGALVLVFQVIRVFPNIDAENRHLVIHVGAVLVSGADDCQLAALRYQPAPAAAEAARGRFLVLGFEGVEVAESLLDIIRQGPARLTATALGHNLPEHAVVGVATPIVAHRGPDVFGHLVDLAEQVLDPLVLQIGMSFECLVQIVHVGLVVPIVVNLHGLGVNGRLQGIVGIRQWGERESHGVLRSGNRVAPPPTTVRRDRRMALVYACARWKATAALNRYDSVLPSSATMLARRIPPSCGT